MQLDGVFAEFERATIIDRIVAGMERKAARGEWQNGRRTHGYLVINDLEAPTIRTIFDLYARRRLGAAIAALFTKRGAAHLTGKPWNTRAVLTVLRNRVYLGEIHYRGVWHIGKPHPSPTDHRVRPARAGPARVGIARRKPHQTRQQLLRTTSSPDSSPAPAAARSELVSSSSVQLNGRLTDRGKFFAAG